MEDVKPPTAGKHRPATTPCLCAALRQASRAVTRIYDAELRGTGLRSTQHSLLRLLGRVGEVRQGDLGEMASLDETTLTRNLRPLEKSGWVTIRAGSDRREKLVAITDAGKKKSSRPVRRGRGLRNGCGGLCRKGRGIPFSRRCRRSRSRL